MSNLYDDLRIDIEKAHKEINSNIILCSNRESHLHLTHKLLHKLKVYDKLIDSGFIRYWFEEFLEYWIRVLNGRPLQFHDFFYLYCSYRTKFQYISVNENPAQEEFLSAWQKSENIYSIFSCVYKNALRPFLCFHFLPYLKKKNGGSILEYGCGIAPVTTSMIKCKIKDYKFTIADIRNYTYHYAKFRLKQHGVKFVDIIPYNPPSFEDHFDIIFLLNVLEHLPDPVKTTELLTSCLKKDGFLIFDYILGEGKGLDTLESIKQRKQVLDLACDRYKTVKGEIKYEESMGITVLQKI